MHTTTFNLYQPIVSTNHLLSVSTNLNSLLAGEMWLSSLLLGLGGYVAN